MLDGRYYKMTQIKRRPRWTHVLATTAIALAVTPLAYAEPPSNRKWVKTFEDNFNGNLNTNIWTIQTGRWKDSIRKPQNVFTQNGNLVIRTSKSGSDYHTGFIRTRKAANLTFSQKYGYFEARMKLNTARGQWAAFWLMPKGTIHNVNNSGRDGTEIDIVEGFGLVQNQIINQAIHYDGYGPSEVAILNGVDMKGKADQWHTYAVEWTPTKYTWYVDGVPTWTLNDPKQISQVKQYMKLTTEVKFNANWVGTFDDSKLPADTLVDYVRVWRDDGPASGGGSPPPPPPPNSPPPSNTSGQTVEIENMQLARLTKISNNNASADRVAKVSPGNSVGYAKKTYNGATGNQTLTISYFNNPGSAYIKLVVNGAVKKTWPLTGTGGRKTLSHTTYLRSGDTIQIKAAGAAHLDKLTYGSGSTSGGSSSPPPPPPPSSTSSKSFEAERLTLTRMTPKSKSGASANSTARVNAGQSMGIVEAKLAGAGGSKNMKLTVFDQVRGDLVKFYVNGQIKKTWTMNGGGRSRVLDYQGNFNSGDTLTYKVWGSTLADKLEY